MANISIPTIGHRISYLGQGIPGIPGLQGNQWVWTAAAGGLLFIVLLKKKCRRALK